MTTRHLPRERLPNRRASETFVFKLKDFITAPPSRIWQTVASAKFLLAIIR